MDLDRTTKTKLNKSGESRHFCLVSDFRGKAFGFLQSSMMLAVYFSYVLNYVEMQSFYTYFVKKSFYCKWMLNLSNTFSVSFEDMIFTFILFIWCNTLNNL